MNDTNELGQALRRQAQDIDGSGHVVTLDDVQARARGIRRRRTALTGAVAVVAVALAIPAGIAVNDRINDSVPRPVPATTPNPAPTPDASLAPDEVTLDAAVTATSGPISVPVLYEREIHLPGGGTVAVPHDYQQFAAFGDGWVGLRDGTDQTALIDFLDAAGQVTRSESSTYSFAVTRDHSIVSYVTKSGKIMVVADGNDPIELDKLPGGQGYHAVAMYGSGRCLETEGDGCVVYVNPDGGDQAMFGSSHGITDTAFGLMTVDGLAPDYRVAGKVSGTRDGSCSAVFAASGVEAMRTCDFTLGEFSPDGTQIIGHEAFNFGGPGFLNILDANDGKPSTTFLNSDQAILLFSTWDSDGTVIGLLYQGDSFFVMRMTADGQVSHASIDGVGEFPAAPGVDSPIFATQG